MSTIPSLVETSWLFKNLENENVRVLDASYHLPNSDRNGLEEFKVSHISGAQFFDVDGVKDAANPLPHMMPDAPTFSEAVSKLGITNSNHVIVYDVHGLFSAARVWWMFRTFGHNKISILNGGLKKWLAEGLPTTSELTTPVPGEPFVADLDADKIVNYGQLLEHIKLEDAFILDARSQGRFDGVDPEPRVGLPSGHMPGSTCLPFAKLLSEEGTVKSVVEVREIFNKAGFNNQKLVITSCGSGVTAAVLTFGLHLLGYEGTKLYDGSWSEYADIESSVILK